MIPSSLSRYTSRLGLFRPGLWSFSCRSSSHRKFVSSCWGYRQREVLNFIWSSPHLPLIDFLVFSRYRLPSRWNLQFSSILEETLDLKVDKEAIQPQHQVYLLTLQGLSAWYSKSWAGRGLTFLRFLEVKSFTCRGHIHIRTDSFKRKSFYWSN